MKIYYYIGLNRKGQKEQELVEIPDYEAEEWITFAIEQGIKVDTSLSLEKQVQKLVDASFEEEFQRDRKEFRHTIPFGELTDDEGNVIDGVDLVVDTAPNQLEQILEEERHDLLEQIEEEFQKSLTEKQLRRLKLFKQGLSNIEISKLENVDHTSISQTFQQLKNKYQKIYKTYFK